MSGCTLYNALDLVDRYYQILMRESDIPLTAVSTPSGMLWEWVVMPQRLSNSPATFNRLVTQVFRPLRTFAQTYFDDIFVHSRAEGGQTAMEVHLRHLRRVFEVMRANKLYANIDNAGYAELARPLSDLFKKDADWVWEQQHQDHQGELTASASPGLAGQNKSFSVVCDASDYAIGCALLQKDDEGRERVISFQSRQLKAAERNYPVHDKELLAMKYALVKFRVHLLGTRPFVIYTDHASLRTATNSPHLSQRMARWLSFFAEYNLRVEYKPGEFNVLADALSRRPEYELAHVSRVTTDLYDRSTTEPSCANRLVELISLSFVFGLPVDDKGNTGILVSVCRLSKMVHLASVRDKVTGKHAAQLFLEYSAIMNIVSDRDPRFTGAFWDTLFQLLGTKLTMSTADHPQTNGQTERVNRVLVDTLRSICAKAPRSWSDQLLMVEFALINAVHASTGFTPFYLNGLRHPQVSLTLRGGTVTTIVSGGEARKAFSSQVSGIEPESTMVAPAGKTPRHTLTPAERKVCLEALRRERRVHREEERKTREKAAAAVPQKKAAAKASGAEAKGSVAEAMTVVAEAKASVEGVRAEPAEAKTTGNTKKKPDRKKAPAQTPMIWRVDSVLATTNAQATNAVPASMATADDAAEVEGAVASMVSMVVEEVTPNKAQTAMTNSRRPNEKPDSSGKRKSVESGDSRKRRRSILQEEKEANDEEIPSDEDNTDVTVVSGGGTAPVSLACVVGGDPNLMSGEAAACTGLNSDEDSDMREEPEDEEEADDDRWVGEWDTGSLTDEDSDEEMEELPGSVCSSAAKGSKFTKTQCGTIGGVSMLFTDETKFGPDPTYADLYDGSFGPTQSVLVVSDDPLALLFYFMPPKLWAQIAVESNTYHRQSIPQRARISRAQQRKSGGEVEALDDIQRR
ncbi:Pol protein [Phytophthora palmivora]|uniref:Pol protein n=1 Tax=Phytophthora palmivora TaxID=4796 RepID=A0A2P4X017_9STRA|nr:Pol protein [Phytophthora palmivora]